MVELTDGTQPMDVLGQVIYDLAAAGTSLPNSTRLMVQLGNAASGASAVVDRALGVSKSLASIGAQAGIPGLSAIPSLQDELSTILRSGLPNEDITLLRDPISAVVDALLTDLSRSGTTAVLCFDGHENSQPATDRWLASFVLRLPDSAVIVITSQQSLTRHWHEMSPVVRVITLESFDESEAWECFLCHSGATELDPALEERLRTDLAITKGLPYTIGVAGELFRRGAAQSGSDFADELYSEVATRLMSTMAADSRTALLACAVLRIVDEPSLSKVLRSEKAEELLREVSGLPIARSYEHGLALHDLARAAILAQARRGMPANVRELHLRAREYYRDLEVARGGTATWQAAAEFAFHALSYDLHTGFQEIAVLVRRALERSELTLASRLVSETEAFSMDTSQRAICKYWTAEVALRSGHFEEARAVILPELPKLPRGSEFDVGSEQMLGRIAYSTGDVLGADGHLTRALALARDATLDQAAFYITEQLAKMKRMQGNLGRALELHQAAMDGLGVAGSDPYLACSVPGSFGTTQMMAGNFDEADRLLSESVRRARAGDFRGFLATGLRSRGASRGLAGRIRDALDDLRECRELSEQMEDGYNSAVAQMYAADIEWRDLRSAGASDVLDSAIDALTSVGARFDLVNAISAKGELATGQGDPAGLKLVESAIRLSDDLRFEYGSAWARLRLVRARRRLGTFDDELALDALGRASRIAAGYLVASLSVEMSWFAAGRDDALPAPDPLVERYADLQSARLSMESLSTPEVAGSQQKLAQALACAGSHSYGCAWNLVSDCVMTFDSRTAGGVRSSLLVALREQVPDTNNASWTCRNSLQELIGGA